MSNPYPKHGTRARYRNLNCRCVACTSRSGPVSADYQIRWPYQPLQRYFGPEQLEAWYDDEQIAEWRKSGLTDEEADTVAVTLGALPFLVWGGYIEAGLDYGVDVNNASVG